MTPVAVPTDRLELGRAFERVKANGGCRGADGMSVADFERRLASEIDRLQDRLLSRRYRPFPLLQIEVPKRSGGRRRLAVPTVRDRVVQTAVYEATVARFEIEFETCSHGYRRGRSVRSAIEQVCELRDRGFRWVVDAGIDSFFDRIPHDRLFERLDRLSLGGAIRSLFELWIGAEVYDGDRLWIIDEGVPQGAVVSPLLANLFLDDLDEALAHDGQRVVRYADDFVVLCESLLDAERALEVTDVIVDRLGLELDREKSKIASFAGGFRFLGAAFLRDEVLLPFSLNRRASPPPQLPAPLDLWTYLELRALGAKPW